MRLKSEHMPLECGETDHTVSNSFQNDVFSAHFTFQEKRERSSLDWKVILLFSRTYLSKRLQKGGEVKKKKAKAVQTRRALCRNSALPCWLIIANICGSSVSL